MTDLTHSLSESSQLCPRYFCWNGVPYRGGRQITRVDVDELENARNSGILANLNPCRRLFGTKERKEFGVLLTCLHAVSTGRLYSFKTL
jgi:hypothetical protein